MNQEKKPEIVVSVRPVYFRMSSNESTQMKKFRDNEDDEISSQGSTAVTLEEAEAGLNKPKWYRRDRANSVKRWLSSAASTKATRRQKWCRWLLIVIVVLGVFGIVAAIIYVSLVGKLISRLSPPPSQNRIDHIVEQWKEPDANGAFKYEWKDDFSRDIVPKNCHSHNDYWRRVPLYQALAAGCTSVEADVFLTDDNELLVGHTRESTKSTRTLRSLYLDPITNIFEQRNVSTASTSHKETGVFDTDSNASITLLIDFKSDGHKIWPVLQSQLETLRKKNWLTYYDGKAVHQGPLTIVGTGNTPFELVQQNSTNRYIFYDAPLRTISEPQYNSTNTYYASTSFGASVGRLWLGHITSKQERTMKQQIQAAEEKELKSRYWDTPAWPISMRDHVWGKLMELNVGMLNVDDLASATRWNWGFCVVAGFVLCGKT